MVGSGSGMIIPDPDPQPCKLTLWTPTRSLAETPESAEMLRYFAQICLQFICKIYLFFFEIFKFLSTCTIINQVIVCKYISLLEFQIPAFPAFCKTAINRPTRVLYFRPNLAPFQDSTALRAPTSLPRGGWSMGSGPPGATARPTWSTYPWTASSRDSSRKGQLEKKLKE